jgi:TolA-binding protein
LVFAIEAVSAARASDRGVSQAWGITRWFANLLAEAAIKLDRAANLDRDNEELRTRAAELELANARLEAANYDCLESRRAELIKSDARREGGLEASRTIASLKLADETLLTRPPRTIFELASHALARGDFETAAKGFMHLADSHMDGLQTPQTYFLAGYSLFKLRSYKKALNYLNEAARRAQGDDLAYAPRALAWVVLCHAKLGNKAESQRAAQDLLQRFPKSSEARRLNRNA